MLAMAVVAPGLVVAVTVAVPWVAEKGSGERTMSKQEINTNYY